MIPLIVLTVKGIQHLARNLKFGSASLSDSGPRVIAAVLSLCLVSFVTFFLRAGPYVVVATVFTIFVGARLFGIRRLSTDDEREEAERLVSGFD